MRDIKVYKLDELSPEARQTAIKNHREWMEDNLSWEALAWAMDDCALFEPPHEEMVKACGEDYYERNGDRFVFKHTRGDIDGDPLNTGELNISKSLEITNDDMFYAWLGIPEGLRKYVTYEFVELNRTQIEFEIHRLTDNPLEDLLKGILSEASDKFDLHMQSIVGRIRDSERAYYDEENVVDSIEDVYDMEFFEDGERFTKSKSKYREA